MKSSGEQQGEPTAASDEETTGGSPLRPASPSAAGEVPISDNCAICIDKISSELDTCTTSCGHKFHLSCMLETLRYCIYSPDMGCPLCRAVLSRRSRFSVDEKDLLRAVTRRDWDTMHALMARGVAFVAQIEPDDYGHGVTTNLGMTALYFAVRDHAPLEIIQEIYQARPQALHVRDYVGLTPLEDFFRVSPNEPSYATDEEFQAVSLYLASLPGPGPPG